MLNDSLKICPSRSADNTDSMFVFPKTSLSDNYLSGINLQKTMFCNKDSISNNPILKTSPLKNIILNTNETSTKSKNEEE